ncbi:MAG: hypothetical protein MZV64_03320 [Ignavibacteriales bacterium]|nr:hypothetical protein [Ignavibacteriales bacterium]
MSKEMFENIFSKILELCTNAGLIDGKHQSIDSTLVKANASLESVERKEPKLTVAEYINKRYEENQENEKESDEQKAEVKRTAERTTEKSPKEEGKSNQNYESKTDSDSRMVSKPW